MGLRFPENEVLRTARSQAHELLSPVRLCESTGILILRYSQAFLEELV
jgi:hypothetical protein